MAHRIVTSASPTVMTTRLPVAKMRATVMTPSETHHARPNVDNSSVLSATIRAPLNGSANKVSLSQ